MRTTSSIAPVAPTARKALAIFVALAFGIESAKTDTLLSLVRPTTTALTGVANGLPDLYVSVGTFGVTSIATISSFLKISNLPSKWSTRHVTSTV
ncbi:unannotated protein [freshwater metagenome]|uniref:Unannotated protein n=1 Tax=freshwater metagenome TaxID=449393 RepID=A0A6J7TN41_9ZZZZ